MQTQFRIATSGAGLYEFTDTAAAWLTGEGDGLLTLFVRHTSCSLLVQENADPDVRRDLDAFFDRLVPPATDPSMSYLTHLMEGPDDMPAHIKAALLPVSLSIPVNSGRISARNLAGGLPIRTSPPPAPTPGGGAFRPRLVLRHQVDLAHAVARIGIESVHHRIRHVGRHQLVGL